MTNPTPHGRVPDALPAIQRFEVVDCIDSKHVPAVIPKPHGPWVRYEDHAAALCRLHAENEALRAQQDDAYDHGPQAETVEEAARDVGKWLNERPNRPLDLRHVAMLTHHAKRTAHVQNPAEIEHVAGDVSKNGAESNMSTQQTAPAGFVPVAAFDRLYAHAESLAAQLLATPQRDVQEPCGWIDDWTHSSATGKPDTTYTGFTKDEAHARKHDNCIAVFTTQQPAPATQQVGEVVAYLDIGAGGYLDLGSTLSDEALQQLPKGRHALVIAGTYGIDGYVATPQPSPTAQAAESVPAVDGALEVADAMADSQYLAGVSAGWNAANADDPNAALQKLHESRAGYLKPLLAARAPADSVPAGPRRKDMLWSTVKMQERYDQRIENIVSGLERIKQEHAGQQPQKIDECYGDCPTDSTTCTNPCRFDGRAARAPGRERGAGCGAAGLPDRTEGLRGE